MRVKCPTCKGHGFVTDVTVHLVDPACPMCQGKKFVDTKFKCKCGRPAIRQVGATIVCAAEVCYDVALRLEKSSNPNEGAGVPPQMLWV